MRLTQKQDDVESIVHSFAYALRKCIAMSRMYFYIGILSAASRFKSYENNIHSGLHNS